MRNVTNAVGVIGCLIILAFLVWTLTGGYDVVLATLQVQAAEAEARTTEAQVGIENAQAEQSWAEVAKIQAESQARTNETLIKSLTRQLDKQGRRATFGAMVNGLLVACLIANTVIWGAYGIVVVRDKKR